MEVSVHKTLFFSFAFSPIKFKQIDIRRVTWKCTGLEDGIVTKESECVLSSGHCPLHLNLLTLIETVILEFVDTRHANLEDPTELTYWFNRSTLIRAINHNNKRHIIISLSSRPFTFRCVHISGECEWWWPQSH
jgi:hypothetical protein